MQGLNDAPDDSQHLRFSQYFRLSNFHLFTESEGNVFRLDRVRRVLVLEGRKIFGQSAASQLGLLDLVLQLLGARRTHALWEISGGIQELRQLRMRQITLL